MRAETIQRDLRGTAFFQEVEALYRALRQPGSGQISDAADVHVSPGGEQAVFAGTLIDRLEGTPVTRICRVEIASGDTRVLSFGPGIDRVPKFSPSSRQIAFLSDRHEAGNFQLYLMDVSSGAARPAPQVEGWIEYLQWSPDGRRILLGVAGHGADVAGGQGAITSARISKDIPAWMPTVESGNEAYRWRSAWVYELETDHVERVSPSSSNIWEAAWCGNEALAAVTSPGPDEGLWYSARLHIIDIKSSTSRELYVPQYQMGWPSAAPSGQCLALVTAICSDRWIVAGDLQLIDVASGTVRQVNTHGIDITCTEWRSDQKLLVAGHRGAETVVGLCDAVSAELTEVWSSTEISTGGTYITVSGLNESGDCVLVGEGFTRAPEIAVIRSGQYRAVRSFDLSYQDQIRAMQAAESVTWKSADGLEIQGWLLRPKAAAPHPLVMMVHGGPVWHWRPRWLGRASIPALLLLNKGYAVFLPNPRGSAGRGQEFIRHVLGDMGGGDAQDCLSGLDHLVAKGIADPKRLGVTGVSYGGFMTSWLISQDSRFAAAVSVAPITNHVTEHLVSNIPHFVRLFVADRYTNTDGKYYQRSPVMHAHQVKTPTLNICGALDRCTPPEQAAQFHNALLESEVTSVLVTYPTEGHGIRKLPAMIDYAARVVGWFEEHMHGSRESA